MRWLTITRHPATLMNPSLDAGPGLASSNTVTVPDPAPEVLLVILIQDAVEDAVQGHPSGAVTVRLCVPPLTTRLPGDTE